MKWSELFSRVSTEGSYKYKDIWFTARHLDHPSCVSLADVIKCEYNVGAIKELARFRQLFAGARLLSCKTKPPIDCRWADTLMAEHRHSNLYSKTTDTTDTNSQSTQLQLPL